MAKLNAAERKALPASDFAGKKGKSGGSGSYPIPNQNHARLALAMVSRFGSPSKKAQVRAKVHAKFPGIGKKGRQTYSRMNNG